jgi:hypothetical protein
MTSGIPTPPHSGSFPSPEKLFIKPHCRLVSIGNSNRFCFGIILSTGFIGFGIGGINLLDGKLLCQLQCGFICIFIKAGKFIVLTELVRLQYLE